MNPLCAAFSDRLLEAAFHSGAIGMALVTTDGRFLEVNDALCRFLGCSKQELQGKSFQELVHPEDLNAELELMPRLLAGEIDHFEFEKRYIHKAGHTVWIHCSGVLARSEKGRPEMCLAQFQDITARKALESALKTSLTATEQSLAQADTAHANVRKLQKTLLTVCPWTKRIQHEGRWISIDDFLSSLLSIQISHGISEEAYAGVMAEVGELERRRRES